ncbi:hypothetical protein CPB86DRAFT_745831, partial [Serendipita vermifera]
MVVMEHLAFEEGIGGLGRIIQVSMEPWNQGRCEIITLLQGQKMVHVDLRPKNIMVKVDENGDMVMSGDEPILSVIDFDWSGIVGDVRYSPFLN